MAGTALKSLLTLWDTCTKTFSDYFDLEIPIGFIIE